MARMRAAASSMARGSPSRRRTISTTSATLSGPRANPGRAAMARSTKSRAAGASAASAAPAPSSGMASGRTRHTCSPGSPSTSRLVARMVTSGHQLRSRSDERGDGGSQMLAVVENQQGPARSQILDQGVLDGQMLALLYIDRGGDGGDGRCRVAAPVRARPRRPRRRTRPTASLASRMAIRVLPTPPGPVSVHQSVDSQPAGEQLELIGPTDQPGDSAGSCRAADRRAATGG